MTDDLDTLLDTARIVRPEEAASDPNELALMHILASVHRAAGLPFNVVQFQDGVVIGLSVDPDNKEAWKAKLAEAYKARKAGYVGPLPIDVDHE